MAGSASPMRSAKSVVRHLSFLLPAMAAPTWVLCFSRLGAPTMYAQKCCIVWFCIVRIVCCVLYCMYCIVWYVLSPRHVVGTQEPASIASLLFSKRSTPAPLWGDRLRRIPAMGKVVVLLRGRFPPHWKNSSFQAFRPFRFEDHPGSTKLSRTLN